MGVFEFSFRDERYMPFEGAGAISTWALALPKSFRPFGYHTISDVHGQLEAAEQRSRSSSMCLVVIAQLALVRGAKPDPPGTDPVFSVHQGASTSGQRPARTHAEERRTGPGSDHAALRGAGRARLGGARLRDGNLRLHGSGRCRERFGVVSGDAGKGNADRGWGNPPPAAGVSPGVLVRAAVYSEESPGEAFEAGVVLQVRGGATT